MCLPFCLNFVKKCLPFRLNFFLNDCNNEIVCCKVNKVLITHTITTRNKLGDVTIVTLETHVNL